MVRVVHLFVCLILLTHQTSPTIAGLCSKAQCQALFDIVIYYQYLTPLQDYYSVGRHAQKMRLELDDKY